MTSRESRSSRQSDLSKRSKRSKQSKRSKKGRGSKRDHESDGAPPAENSISSDAVVQSHLSLDHTRSMVLSNGRHSSEQKLKSPEEENSLGQGWNKPNVNRNGVPIVSVPLPENSLGRIYSSREQTETMLRSKYNSSNEKTPLGKMQNLGDGQQRSQHVEYQYMLSIEDHAVPEKRRMGRRSSMPFTSTSSDHAEAKMASLRRAKSAEKLFVVVETVDAPPMIVFPPEKINVEEVKGLSTDLRDYKLIHNNIKNRKSSRSDGLSVNGSMDDSIALSCTGSLTSSGFAPSELDRLKRTIQRLGADGPKKRSSFGSVSSTGTIGSSIVIAQLELLHKRMTQVYGDEKSSDGSATSQSRKVSVEESLAMSGSIRSLNTQESTLMDAFFDPSIDKPPFLTIYYGTQSGTSEYYAYALQQEGQAMGLDVCICNIGQLIHSVEMSLDQDLNDILVPFRSTTGKRRGRAVFLVSTYQNGGPTDDSKSFVQALNEIKDHKYFKGLRYAVFGFGSSNFAASYNTQGKVYDQLLAQLGGTRLIPLGLGDDAQDIDWDFEQWKWKSWWPNFADLAARENHNSQVSEVGNNCSKKKSRKKESDGMEEKYCVEYILPTAFGQHKLACDKIPLQTTSKHFREGAEYAVKAVKPLWRDQELTPSLKQLGSTMHVALDTSSPIGTPLNFATGDNIVIIPKNRPSLVEEVAKQLGYDLDAMFILKPSDGTQEYGFELPFPIPCSVRDFLTKYAELTTPPRRSVVRALSKCATDPQEREEMYQLSSKKHREKYRSYVVDQHIGFGEFISTYFQSIEMPLAKFITLCTPLQPRWYSLSGSTLMHKDEVHLTFAVVSMTRSVDSSVAQGTASHYLGSLPIGSRVRIIRSVSSGFVVPTDARTPLIMIANGAGIAPMLALIQERHYQKTELQSKVGPTELFFGIRRRDLDFLYRDELRRYKVAGSLSSLQLACSREQMHKIYVQHLLVKHSEHIWRLLQRGAHIYVCGGTSMGSEVDHVLRAIVLRHQDEGNALSVDEFFTELKKSGRYVQEAFDTVHT
jgi:NADPH-ferrihemoprotein reductase